MKFATKVDENSAEKVANYTVTAEAPSAEGAKTVADVELQEDGKSVIVRFGGTTPQLVKNTVYSIKVNNVLSAEFEKIATYEGTITVTQDAAPSLASAKFEGSNLNLTFNEEVDFTNAIVKVDGVQIAAPFAATSTDAGSYEYAAAVSGAAAEQGTHTVTIVGLKDRAGNEAGTLTASYTVSDDVVAPTVSKVEAVDSNTFKIVFSEALSGAPTVKTVKGTTVFGNTVSPTAKPNEWTVDVASTAGSNNLYETGETTINLAVEVTNYKDTANLLGNKYTTNVTLSGDVTGPAVLSQNLNTVASINGGTDTAITIKFNEAITVGTGTITVKDPDGIIQTATASASTDELTLTIAGHATKQGTYTIILGAGAVEDTAGNGNAALTTTASFTTAASVYELPIGAATTSTSVVKGKVVNKITVNFGTNMDDSAIDLANYKLDNVDLPDGTTIGFDGDKQHVAIILPDTFVVPAQSDFKFEISKDVKTDTGAEVRLDDGNAGTVSTATYVDTISLDDNKAPVLKSAKLLNAGSAATTQADQIELTFSEALAAVADDADHIGDFIVKVNGIEVTPAHITDGTANDEKVVLELPSAINTSQTVTVEVAAKDIDVADVAGNTLTTNTKVTATK